LLFDLDAIWGAVISSNVERTSGGRAPGGTLAEMGPRKTAVFTERTYLTMAVPWVGNTTREKILSFCGGLGRPLVM